MADVVKSGWIQRYSKSFLDGGWRKVWVVLHNNSVLKWYKKQTDSDSKGDILLKEVCKWFSVGQYTNGMPDQPDLPAGAKLEHLLAIPVKPSSRAKIIWFLFTNDNELNEWMNAIVSVLPPAPRKSQQPKAAAVSAPYPTVQATQANTVMAGARYAMPSAPPANAPSPYSTHAPSYPQQASYTQQASYPQQPGYPPQQAAYHGYPPQQAAYPPQAYFSQQPAAYSQVPPPPPGYAGAYPGYYPQQGPYYGNTGNPQVVHIKEKNKSNLGEIALGVAGGALLAHGATSMMGGWGGGWGLGRWGSWSSLSSLSSFGSCGSFGSFGSFD
ncbi:calcium-binding protein P isoform X2 [Octopus bimaculoides]|uniref:PH domain-containing protein n=1 Tax=Octopus bimaculoides TaxID=37653 RepID=A0A0L8G739_OCTBM|nr:calcium-binding protein P isoform X2 [Octopus bimaculoides]